MLLGVKVPTGAVFVPSPRSLSNAFAYLKTPVSNIAHRSRKSSFLPCSIAVKSSNRLSAVRKDIALNQDLSSISSIDSGIHIQEVRIVHMTSTVSNAWSSATNIEPIVVMLSNMEMAGVFSSIVVAVAN
jgi:hypothetical protein